MNRNQRAFYGIGLGVAAAMICWIAITYCAVVPFVIGFAIGIAISLSASWETLTNMEKKRRHD